jgi:hypothetical protein
MLGWQNVEILLPRITIGMTNDRDNCGGMYLNFDSKQIQTNMLMRDILSNVVKAIKGRLSCAEFEVVSEDGFRI